MFNVSGVSISGLGEGVGFGGGGGGMGLGGYQLGVNVPLKALFLVLQKVPVILLSWIYSSHSQLTYVRAVYPTSVF